MSEMGADAAVSGKDREECRRSDGTLILAWGAPTGGTDFTIQMAEKHKKPYLVFDLGETEDPTGVVNWIETHGIAILNVPGPRESKVPGIHKRSITFLHQVFKDLSLKG